MGRPPKNKSQLMNVPLRIMVTAEQKQLIDEALELERSEFAAWARAVLLRAAERRVAQAKARTTDAE
jgi:hypothetical protein